MDGIKKQKPIQKNRALKVDFIDDMVAKSRRESAQSFGLMTKLVVAVVLVSLSPWVMPHESVAAERTPETDKPLVFEVGDHTEYMRQIEVTTEQKIHQEKHEQAVAKLKSQLKMNEALKQYLVSKRSPLAEYSSVILQQNNWKKIVALSNAESTMCRHYIEETANCWGVGGSDLWDMGENLGQGVVAMNNFLNSSPRASGIKYSQMNFDQMNGLYKQPAGDHWVYNNLQVYNELTALEKSLK